MQNQSGFTLMEVMITVAIIAILTSIAVPSYLNYVTASRHKEAKSAVLELGQFMERYYTAHDRYNNTDDSTLSEGDLPFSTVPKEGGAAYYNITVNSLHLLTL
ncbi:type IV pilin protein [uncultured Tolumonas sp.]|uniref:type IV pilin protein n=1 Tax=uncultured Tolumonas sp. TaxID=263765 RepID=UPI00292F30D4|nr:type IV pilin protein [uncultured Tolumonas sp.]